MAYRTRKKATTKRRSVSRTYSSRSTTRKRSTTRRTASARPTTLRLVIDHAANRPSLADMAMTKTQKVL